MNQSLDVVLRPIHDDWLREARRHLEPALETDADFWTRWAAVRYIADEFQARFRRERALLDELHPLLEPESHQHLIGRRERLSRLRLELDRLGRRRAPAAEFAAVTQELLAQLGKWCAEIQQAVVGLTRSNLPPKGEEVLGHLERALQPRQ